jgi:hypothetical protein
MEGASEYLSLVDLKSTLTDALLVNDYSSFYDFVTYQFL